MMRNYLLCLFYLFSVTVFSQNKLEVFFDFNKDVPNELSQIKINQWVLEHKNAEIIRVLGYCDSVDDSEYNKELAMRRINTMITFFKDNAVKISDKVELKAFGKDFDYSKNQSENRKVVVFYTEVEVIIPKDVTVESDFQLTQLSTLVAEEKSTLASKFDKAKKGDLIRINNISFYFNSEKVMQQSEPILEELYQIMVANPKLRIEIHGHICCNPNPNDTKLSYRRALVILKYLTKKGIPVNRMNFKGYGSNDPIYRLPERNEKERAANRRVEILIVAKQ
ncbi:OmpA family protein [Flavobacterium sp. j3]|uniref:OmpA family protein n=1 Tax=Flavobacterium aureirubrum TaxID=3133147 RepID=A0ABU9N996_9FLAO